VQDLTGPFMTIRVAS